MSEWVGELGGLEAVVLKAMQSATMRLCACACGAPSSLSPDYYLLAAAAAAAIVSCCVVSGDLSMGDPGFSRLGGGDGASGGGGGGGGADWWSAADGELLSAPKRMAGRGVNYQRSAKQVCV